MPEYYSKDEIINMFNNSEEVINSHDIKLLEVRQNYIQLVFILIIKIIY